MVAVTPALPAAYDLDVLAGVPCLRDHVVDLARSGAAEGCIMLARSVESRRESGGALASEPPGNLHAALVLEPEGPPTRDAEILFVTLVSLGAAIATHVSPMTALGYGWPNILHVAGMPLAEAWLDRGVDGRRRWITVTVSVNVAAAPDDDGISLLEAEGAAAPDIDTLFETWAREFLRWINDWDERGLPHVLGAWRQRADISGQPVAIRHPGGDISGTAAGVDDHGHLLVDAVDGRRHSLAPDLFLDWDEWLEESA